MSNNLSRTETLSNQNQKEVTLNDSDGILDAAITAKLTVLVDDTNVYTLTTTEFTQASLFFVEDGSPVPTADITLNVPSATRGMFAVVNNTSYSITVQRSGQALTAPTLISGNNGVFLYDGTNVYAAGSTVSSLGDLTDLDIASPAPAANQHLEFDGTKWVAGDIPYDIPISFSGTPTTSGQLLGKLILPRTVTFNANFSGSFGNVGTNPSITYDIDVKASGTTIGTISISVGGAFTFSTVGGVSKTIAAGSRIEFYAPEGSPTDWTISDIAATLLGRL